jgi:hypothetical protein
LHITSTSNERVDHIAFVVEVFGPFFLVFNHLEEFGEVYASAHVLVHLRAHISREQSYKRAYTHSRIDSHRVCTLILAQLLLHVKVTMRSTSLII